MANSIVFISYSSARLIVCASRTTRAPTSGVSTRARRALPLVGIVGDRHDVGLAEREAPHAAEVDELLQRHAVGAVCSQRGEQLVDVVHLVHVLPAAARVRLQDRRPADVIEQALPVKGVLQVPKRLGRQIDIRRIVLLRQQHRARIAIPSLAAIA